MANQLLALEIQRPRFSFPDALSNAQTLTRGRQAIERGQMTNELEGLRLRDESAESNALADYRAAAKAGDPKAMDKLRGFPEVASKIHAALESMKPDEKKAVRAKTRAFGEAARYVLSLPEGPQRTEAWNAKIGELAEAGYIDETQAQGALDSGPNDLLIQQALDVDDWVSAYFKDKGDLPKGVKEVEDALADYRKTITPKGDVIPSLDDQARIDAAVEAERARLESLYGVSGKKTGAGKGDAAVEGAGRFDPEAEGKGVGRARKGGDGDLPEVAPAEVSKDNARQVPLSHKGAPTPRSQEEFDALPAGAPFINPADGKFLFKK